MVMIIDLPVAPYAPPEQIEEWIGQLEAMREDPDAEPSDLDLVERYIVMARGWLEKAHARRTPESGTPHSSAEHVLPHSGEPRP